MARCIDMLRDRWKQGCYICVGLDPDGEMLPDCLKDRYPTVTADTVWQFNRAIIQATAPYAGAFKLNPAFYYGYERALKMTIEEVRGANPVIPVILDSKRGDVEHANQKYARADFDELGADAVTVHAYPGKKALAPFLSRADKVIFVVCRTTGEGAGELQDIPVRKRPYFEVLAEHIKHVWDNHGNVGLVAGATYPEELLRIRELAPGLPILAPGIGRQGGNLRAIAQAGMDRRGEGLIPSASRSITYASSGSDFADAAGVETKRLNDAFKAYREELL